jgi:hypothetical protein
MHTKESIGSPTFTGLWQEDGIWHAKHNGLWIGSYEHLPTAASALQRRITCAKLTHLRRQLARAAELKAIRIGEE